MRKLLALLLACLCAAPAAAQNYNATAGSGLVFGANLVGGILYPQQNMCDPTTPARCVVVDASGRITVLQGTSPWSVAGPAASGAALSGNPVRVGMSDGTNAQNWLAAIALGDGVNGNNTGAVATWLWNGTTYDRAPGDATNGALVEVSNTLAAVGNNSDNVAAGAGAASPVVNYNYAFDGTTWDRVRTVNVDPCEANVQTYAPISITTATTTRIVAPSASNKTYICMLFLTSAAADNVGIVEGTGGTCGTGTAGVIGGTTAANGPNFAANGGMLLQAGGKVAAAQTAGTNVDLCLITSAATPLAGGIKYVQAP